MYSLPPDVIAKNFLWGLLLLKVYAHEAVNDALSVVHHVTFTKETWIDIGAMESLLNVS